MPEIEEHFQKLIDLIDIEREAEKEENKRELDRWPVETREQLGKTVSRLVIERQDVGVGGMPLLVLSRPPAGEALSPFHAMDSGDIVRVTFLQGNFAKEGTLYDVEEYRVTVALNEELIDPPTGKCQIDLLGSDATYKRMRRALDIVQRATGRLGDLRDVLMGLRSAQTDPPKEIEFYNEGLNTFQKDAVRSALAAKDVALVHGPPGTGKTTVLVEIIRQAALRGLSVLATAPSNIAVDNMLEKLLDSDLRVVRLGHPARTLESLRHATLMAQMDEHPDQKPIALMDRDREQLVVQRYRRQNRGTYDPIEDKEMKKEIKALWKEARNLEKALAKRIIQRAHVVLATHGGIGKNLSGERFDLVCLDEASQSTEPLSWVPILLAQKIVLAGDPLQLPPTIYSKEAAAAGLKTTLMERLQPELPENLQALLRVQYRMNETIMRFSSERFYEGKLIADESVRDHDALGLPHVQPTDLTQGTLVFVDTAGTGYAETWNELLDSRENEGEARLAALLWEELEGAGIRREWTAVISPYGAQVRMLRGFLPKGIEVGTVDGFQGREKEVVIVSLVRSNEKAEVGFLSDTRRMNVAMTRARRLLIVIGDSATIGQHPFYAAFLDHVQAHGQHRSAWEWLKQ
ncbi:MAG: AAA family ATPase [Elusimicrobia bacterium]|nr:AAA family ATPase [Elusimicrobiota bacterium]